MWRFCAVSFVLQLLCVCARGETPTAAAVDTALQQMTPNPEQTFRVRDLQLFRGDLKVYLTEGVISFLTPVNGKVVAAVFSTEPVEAGDAEVIVLPPQRNERAALAAYTKTPNLDEHFDSALFLFTDGTAEEILAAIQQAPIHKMPDLGGQLAVSVRSFVQALGPEIRGQLVAGLLDQHKPEDGFFYGLIGGKTLGSFDVLYNPVEFEQVTIGRASRIEPGAPAFQLWSSFRSRRSGPYRPPPPAVADYRITAEIRPDLTLNADADFKWQAPAGSGRVIPLYIADRVQIDSAQVDGRRAEVFQSTSAVRSVLFEKADEFYLITEQPLTAGSEHTIDVRYHGAVIRKTLKGAYFVDDRSAWYPFARPTLATFDLTFRCPDNLQLVSTGELVSNESKDGIRTVHRVTRIREKMAGFNLGDYQLTAEEHGPYRVECYSNKQVGTESADIPRQMEAVLDYYTERWMPLPIHSVAVSPIPASLGQGFPGLIYLSSLSYVRPENRPEHLRGGAFDQFFSDMLLPHEVAHQWWGNLVTAAEYRSAWIMEALANYSALQFVSEHRGHPVADSILDGYRLNLVNITGGKTVDSHGPLEFGVRLIDSGGPDIWHIITYEKGTWVVHMLRERLGDGGFLNLERRLLHDFADRPITNEDFRKAASEFVPEGQKDKSLSSFFDTWVYGTGIPRLQLKGQDLTVSGVDEDFTADVPLRCSHRGGSKTVRWTRVSSGTNSLELPAGLSCELPSADEFLYLPAT